MADYTQKAILQTFEDMLKEMPFDKITVSAIVSRCEISSNTFYYHYRDIYNLLDIWLNNKKKSVFASLSPEHDWYDTLKSILHKMQDNPQVVYHVFNSITRETFEKFIFNSAEPFFYQLIKEQAKNMDVNDDILNTIAGFYCYSLLGFIIKFIWNRMDAPIESSVECLHVIFDGMAEHIIGNSLKH